MKLVIDRSVPENSRWDISNSTMPDSNQTPAFGNDPGSGSAQSIRQQLQMGADASRLDEARALQQFIFNLYGTTDLSDVSKLRPNHQNITTASPSSAAGWATVLSSCSNLASQPVKKELYSNGFSNDFDKNKKKMKTRAMFWGGRVFPNGSQVFDYTECKFTEWSDLFEVLIEKMYLNIVLMCEEEGMWVLVMVSRSNRGMQAIPEHEKKFYARVISEKVARAQMPNDEGGLPVLVIFDREDIPDDLIVEVFPRFYRYDEFICPTNGSLSGMSMSLALCYVGNANSEMVHLAMEQNRLDDLDLAYAQKLIDATARGRYPELYPPVSPAVQATSHNLEVEAHDTDIHQPHALLSNDHQRTQACSGAEMDAFQTYTRGSLADATNSGYERSSPASSEGSHSCTQVEGYDTETEGISPTSANFHTPCSSSIATPATTNTSPVSPIQNHCSPSNAATLNTDVSSKSKDRIIFGVTVQPAESLAAGDTGLTKVVQKGEMLSEEPQHPTVSQQGQAEVQHSSQTNDLKGNDDDDTEGEASSSNKRKRNKTDEGEVVKPSKRTRKNRD